MGNVKAIPTYEMDLAFLKKISAATAQKITTHPEIQTRIARIAQDIFQIDPDNIHQLPKAIRVLVIEHVINKNLQNKENLQNVMRYLDPEIISELLISSAESNEMVAHQYCATTGSLFLNSNQSSAEIHKMVLKISPSIRASITKLDLSICSFIEDLSFLAEFPNITELNLTRAISLKSVDGIQCLPHLKKLVLSTCQELNNLNGLEHNTALTTLLANDCSNLFDINAIRNCTDLLELDLSNCHSLNGLKVISELKNIRKLNLQGLVYLQSLDFCKELSHLAELNVAGSGVKDISAQVSYKAQ